MPVTVYRSTDAGAPALSATRGTLIGVLDACLVNGYGSKAAAGWSKPYSGTNLAVYRAGGGTQFYYRIDEAGANYVRDASLRGYETMSDVNTGVGDFPRVVDRADGMMLRRSTSTDTTVRAWTVVADNKTCYMFFYDGGSAAGYAKGHMMGDYHSYSPTPAYNAMVIGGTHTVNNSTDGSTHSNLTATSSSTSVATNNDAYWLARDYTQVSTARNAGIHSDYVKNGGSAYFGGSSNSMPFPNAIDGGMYLAPVWVHRSSVVYGELRGFWCPCHNQALADGDTFSGTGVLAGKTFLAINCMHIGNAHQVVVEISDTWKV